MLELMNNIWYLQMQHSDHRQIVLRDLDFEATGLYSCQVSSQSPIFTRASIEQELIIYRELQLNFLYTYSIYKIHLRIIIRKLYLNSFAIL